jgi:hypothetical protein
VTVLANRKNATVAAMPVEPNRLTCVKCDVSIDLQAQAAARTWNCRLRPADRNFWNDALARKDAEALAALYAEGRDNREPARGIPTRNRAWHLLG